MKYDDLQNRYGALISQRVRRDLTAAEFAKIKIEGLGARLSSRAAAAHDEYSRLLNNPLATAETDIARTGVACRRWRDAEDLAYMVAIAGEAAAVARAG